MYFSLNISIENPIHWRKPLGTTFLPRLCFFLGFVVFFDFFGFFGFDLWICVAYVRQNNQNQHLLGVTKIKEPFLGGTKTKATISTERALCEQQNPQFQYGNYTGAQAPFQERIRSHGKERTLAMWYTLEIHSTFNHLKSVLVLPPNGCHHWSEARKGEARANGGSGETTAEVPWLHGSRRDISVVGYKCSHKS